MNSPPTMRSFEEFWPYYLGEHSRAITRWWHFGGTLAALGLLVGLVVLGKWPWLITVPIVGYGPAWLSHFCLEKNRPATFRYPIWSLMGDIKMFGLILTGRINAEVIRILGPDKAAPC